VVKVATVVQHLLQVVAKPKQVAVEVVAITQVQEQVKVALAVEVRVE
jgi:hypothetical protein